MKKWVCGWLALTLILTFTVPVRAASFSDVNDSLWCHQEILDLVDDGVINGYSDGTYRAGNPVTCGAALKLVLLAAGYAAQAPSGSNVFSGYYDYAVRKGLIAKTDVTDLSAPANRLLIARLTAKALNLPSLNELSPYADVDDGYATALRSTGIMTGSVRNGQTVLKAADSINRGEMAAVVWRISHTAWERISRENTHQIFCGGKWYDIIDSVPANTYIDGYTTDAYGWKAYGDSVAGIDVSSHQGDVDWDAVAASGIRFAILRAGYRGYTNGAIVEDAKFRQNIEGATAAGLQVGVYFFSQAITVEEAVEEAQVAMELAQGYALHFPIVFDWETVSSSSARTNNLDKATLTACANAFCDAVEAGGYESMVYFNQYQAYAKYDLPALSGRSCWLAEYSSTPRFYYAFRMWQYSDSGTVPGISGRVDLDLCLQAY